MAAVDKCARVQSRAFIAVKDMKEDKGGFPQMDFCFVAVEGTKGEQKRIRYDCFSPLLHDPPARAN